MVRSKLVLDGTNDPEQVCLQWQNSLGKPLLSKQERYRWLIEKARASYPAEGSAAELTWCDVCEDEINLWTYCQGRGSLNPDILLVGQDWGNPYPKLGKTFLPVEQITPLSQDQAFFKELVNILRPKIVICLGGATFDAALAAYGESRSYSGKFIPAPDAGKTVADIDGIRFFGMGHCGALGCMNRMGNRKGAGTDAGLQMQIQDWKQIRDYLSI